MKKDNFKGTLIILLASLLWGLAFVVQARAADKVPPFTFNCLRSFIAAVFLFAVIKIKNISGKKQNSKAKMPNTKLLIISSCICGILLALSTNLQQFGIALYPTGVAVEARSGFLTALYVIIVPILSIFAKNKISPVIWFSAALAVLGFYMLCLFEGASGFYLGDALMILCAVTFSLHIIAVDKYCDIIGGIRLSAFQFVFCGIISGLFSVIFELNSISIENILSVIPEILYMGVISSGIAYTLQIIGQKYAEPAVASLTMSLESVFAALGGWIISGNALKTNEIIGCLLVFAAIIFAQIPQLLKNKTKD